MDMSVTVGAGSSEEKGTAAKAADIGNGLEAWLDKDAAMGELKRMTAEVDPDLEAATLTYLVGLEKSPALLFENIKGHRAPGAVQHDRLQPVALLPHDRRGPSSIRWTRCASCNRSWGANRTGGSPGRARDQQPERGRGRAIDIGSSRRSECGRWTVSGHLRRR